MTRINFFIIINNKIIIIVIITIKLNIINFYNFILNNFIYFIYNIHKIII